jgi:quercetin dioxygenase-like cupin family protein
MTNPLDGLRFVVPLTLVLPLTLEEAHEHFTGAVWTVVLAETPDANGLRIHRVDFAPRARTWWHVHRFPQHLVVVSGTAIVGFENAPPVHLDEGEAHAVPAGVLHWHGATDLGPMSHLAINFPGVTDWHHPPVSDPDYEDGLARARSSS